MIAATRDRKIKVAIDDLGAGYAGLNLLSLRPEIIKLDTELVRNIDKDRTRQALIRGIIATCASFNCSVVAEGVETRAEYAMLSTLGIILMQGYLFARSETSGFPAITTEIAFTTSSKVTVLSSNLAVYS